MQSSGYFSKGVSFRFKFHCLLRNRVLPLSKNRSPVYFPSPGLGRSGFLLRYTWEDSPSKLTLFHVFSPLPAELLSELGSPSAPRGLLPEEEVPGPAQHAKGSREYWGIVQPGSLGYHKAAEEEVLFLSCRAGRALGLSVLPSTLPARPQGGQWPRQPELPEQPPQGRWNDAGPN